MINEIFANVFYVFLNNSHPRLTSMMWGATTCLMIKIFISDAES